MSAVVKPVFDRGSISPAYYEVPVYIFKINDKRIVEPFIGFLYKIQVDNSGAVNSKK